MGIASHATLILWLGLVLLLGCSAQTGPFCEQLCLSAGSGCIGAAQCPDASCNAVSGNYGGTLKLLDVNMFGWPAHTGRPAVGTSAECCYACADTPGCNVWNFCPLPQGCGAGCTAAKFGPNPGATYAPDPNNLYGPQFRFGSSPYAYNPLQYIPDSSVQCLSSGRFPYQTCTLKSTANPSSPITYNAAGDGDWISGALTDIQAVNAAKTSKSSWISGCDNVTGGC